MRAYGLEELGLSGRKDTGKAGHGAQRLLDQDDALHEGSNALRRVLLGRARLMPCTKKTPCSLDVSRYVRSQRRQCYVLAAYARSTSDVLPVLNVHCGLRAAPAMHVGWQWHQHST